MCVRKMTENGKERGRDWECEGGLRRMRGENRGEEKERKRRKKGGREIEEREKAKEKERRVVEGNNPVS